MAVLDSRFDPFVPSESVPVLTGLTLMRPEIHRVVRTPELKPTSLDAVYTFHTLLFWPTALHCQKPFYYHDSRRLATGSLFP